MLRCSQKIKTKVKLLNNGEKVHITFPSGNVIVVTENESVTHSMMNFDDKIERRAYNMDSLNQTCHLPRSIYCPISRMPMTDPVLCADGFSYERTEILKWFKKSNRSPITGKTMKQFFVIPNHSLRNTISELINPNNTNVS